MVGRRKGDFEALKWNGIPVVVVGESANEASCCGPNDGKSNGFGAEKNIYNG